MKSMNLPTAHVWDTAGKEHYIHVGSVVPPGYFYQADNGEFVNLKVPHVVKMVSRRAMVVPATVSCCEDCGHHHLGD